VFALAEARAVNRHHHHWIWQASSRCLLIALLFVNLPENGIRSLFRRTKRN